VLFAPVASSFPHPDRPSHADAGRSETAANHDRLDRQNIDSDSIL